MSVDSVHSTGTNQESRRPVRPRLKNLKPDAARAILGLILDEDDQKRIHHLCVKNQEAGILAEELDELDLLLNVVMFLDLMRAKSLVVLKKSGQLDDTVLNGE